MNNYRSLSLEEIKLFEKEFTEFLAINGIDADLWTKIKQSDTDKVNHLMDLFSEVVYNTVLMKIKYIQHVDKHSIKYFFYDKDKAHLIGLESTTLNFLETNNLQEEFKKNQHDFSIFKTSKEYTSNREQEIFNMLKNGCSVCDGKIYNLLKSMN